MDKKEKEIQRALGLEAYICKFCRDKGTIVSRDYYETDESSCRHCIKGWFLIWNRWLHDLKSGAVYSVRHVLKKCKDHPEYTGDIRPEVLCDACWILWLSSPKRDEELIDNE